MSNKTPGRPDPHRTPADEFGRHTPSNLAYDRRVLREATARSGAVVLGRRLFDVVDGPDGRDDTTHLTYDVL